MDTLNFVIIHSLERESSREPFVVTLREQVLDTANEHVVSLAEQLVGLVGRDGSAVTYGKFRSDRREGPFPAAVSELANAASAESFIAMSATAMDQLREKADDQNFATGGFVCFVAYRVDGADFLLVAMIKERDALTLTKDFVPTAISEIDLTKLHQAARVNLPSYLSAIRRAEAVAARGEDLDEENGDEDAAGDDPNNTYLSFINKNSRTEVATYFIEALGCERSLSSAKATTRLVVAVTKYVNSVLAISHLDSKARQSVLEYLSEQPDGAVVTLDRIVRIVEHAVGPDLSEHLHEMRTALNGENFRIPEEFKLHAKSLTKYTQISGRAHNWQLKFEVGALDREDSDIVYNADDSSLTLRNLPPELIEKIESELNNRPMTLAGN